MLVKHFYQLKTYKKFCIQLGKVFENDFLQKNPPRRTLRLFSEEQMYYLRKGVFLWWACRVYAPV